MDLDNFITSIEKINQDFSNNSIITSFISGYAQLKQQAGSNPSQFSNLAIQQLENLKKGMPVFHQYNNESIEILKSLNIEKFIGNTGLNTITVLQSQLRANPSNSQTEVQKFVNELNQAKNKPTQILNQLLPFKTESVQIQNNEGVIEIIFNGKVKIENVTDGKEQFNDWFLIIDGYAHLFNMKREDFEIINISKNSPTTIKIKTSLEVAAAILGIIASVYTIEQQYASDRIMVEQLKARPLVDDTLQQQFLQEAEGRLSKNVEREINRIVDQKIEEKQIDTKSRGDIVNSFQKGVEKQYNFVINGGEVKFYLGTESENEQTRDLELKKQEIKELKNKLENIKSLNENNGDQSNTDSNIKENEK